MEDYQPVVIAENLKIVHRTVIKKSYYGSAGVEPRTSRVWREHDNHYTTKLMRRRPVCKQFSEHSQTDTLTDIFPLPPFP